MIQFRSRNRLLLACFKEWKYNRIVSDRIDEKTDQPEVIPLSVNWPDAAKKVKTARDDARQIIEEWILCGWFSREPLSCPDGINVQCGDGIYFFTPPGISECEKRLRDSETPWYLRPWVVAAFTSIIVVNFDRLIVWLFGL